MISKVITICHANVCRSPMAAALLARGTAQVSVTSAGLHALAGQPVAAGSVTVLAEMGIDISAHRAVYLSRDLAADADVILAMTVAQVDQIESVWPTMRGKVYRIGGFMGIDIDDPVGQPLDAFRACRDRLATAADYWAHLFAPLAALQGEPS